MWAISAVVVDLPLVPVMAKKGRVRRVGGAVRAERTARCRRYLDRHGAGEPDRPVRDRISERTPGKDEAAILPTRRLEQVGDGLTALDAWRRGRRCASQRRIGSAAN